MQMRDFPDILICYTCHFCYSKIVNTGSFNWNVFTLTFSRAFEFRQGVSNVLFEVVVLAGLAVCGSWSVAG